MLKTPGAVIWCTWTASNSGLSCTSCQPLQHAQRSAPPSGLAGLVHGMTSCRVYAPNLMVEL